MEAAPHEAGILLHEFSSRVWSMGGALGFTRSGRIRRDRDAADDAR